jgi:hypothetical protein
VEFLNQDSLRDDDERDAVRGGFEELRIRHGGIVGPKCLLLASHG